MGNLACLLTISNTFDLASSTQLHLNALPMYDNNSLDNPLLNGYTV
jgi:hypothetical protein